MNISDLRAKHFPASQLATGKPSKYRNKKTVLDGMVFDSMAEARHWSELLIRQRAGEIRNLRRQVIFECAWNGIPICKYVADFVFEEHKDGEWHQVIADTKGLETALFKLKAKILKATHGVEVRLIRARSR